VACIGLDPSGRALIVSPHGRTAYLTTNGLQKMEGEILPVVGPILKFAHDGSFFVLGETNASVDVDGVTMELSGRMVAKYNSGRRLLWASNLRGSDGDAPFHSGAPTPDGGIVTCAGVEGGTFVSRFDREGRIVWERVYRGFVGSDVAVDSLGGPTVAGTFVDAVNIGNFGLTSRGAEDVAIIHLSESGQEVWVKQLGGTLRDTAVGVGADQDGNLVVAVLFARRTRIDAVEASAEGGAGLDIALVGLAAEGDVRWLRSVGGLGDDEARHLVVDQDGNSYLTHTRDDGPPSTRLPLLAKFDSSGALIWQRRIAVYRAGTGTHLPFAQLAGDLNVPLREINLSSQQDIIGASGWLISVPVGRIVPRRRSGTTIPADLRCMTRCRAGTARQKPKGQPMQIPCARATGV
jgi:hypothetical protein